MEHMRFICPVGQGGLSIERIDDYVVVYDCGSISSPKMAEYCIDHLAHHTNHVNLLFISHFDKDHVNTLRYLLSSVKVMCAVTPMIPDEMKWCYNIYTNGAYIAIMDLLEEYNTEMDRFYNNENGEREYDYKSVWEWVSKSMITQTDFDVLKPKLISAGLVLNLVKNPNYVEKNKEIINNIFKDHFGGKGPNAKGLIMLSQRNKNTNTKKSIIVRDHLLPMPLGVVYKSDMSSCLYVGDADMRNRQNNKTIQSFLGKYRTENMLQLMQIPHHGSRYNVGKNFENDYPALYYFLNDNTTKRLQGNKTLFKSLTSRKKLLVARDCCHDLIYTETIIV